MKTYTYWIETVNGCKFCAIVKAVSYLDAACKGRAEYNASQFNTGDCIKLVQINGGYK